MPILNKIASALGRNDEQPNVEMAEQLVNTRDKEGIAEIVSGLNMDKAVASDCIKVLYEIGERKPELVASYAENFIGLLKSKDNRLVWGAMTALGRIAELNPEPIYSHFEDIYTAYENGSVITVDNSISVFAALCKADKEYEKRILPLLIEHLTKCRVKEIPQHLERMSICFNKNNIKQIASTIQDRFDELSCSQQTRVKKVMKKFRE
jgi:predicted DNA-binding transcriptional regulator